ncbi:MFS transporter [Bacillus spizizenii]|uniref:MFS transporter n=1 Tax=Bacillus spizizenii TaxID=96241 RepID=UPI000772B01D|nr:major facilitator superfamily domain-containing protein 6 [Bacillus spizizenii]KXJ38735.1 MFS transporter [Bacillus spizizenii]OPG93525.1 MFS transporter [Bacillus spizizenii]
MHNLQVRRHYAALKGFYLFAFLGTGSIIPLLSMYLTKEQHVSGSQVGLIMSLGPIVMIFFQPFWGMLSDYTQKTKSLLAVCTSITGIMGLGYIAFDGFPMFILIAACFAAFQSTIIPLSDSISLRYTQETNGNYGGIRLFGSLGFGVAVFVMGQVTNQLYPIHVIFIFGCAFLCIAAILASQMPGQQKTKTKVNIRKGFRELISNKTFLIFMIITFTTFAPNLANNTYFSLFLDKSGASLSAIGILFFIGVISEIPFMRFAQTFIDKMGLLNVIMLSGGVSLFRWALYFTAPSLWLIYATVFLQGVAIGLFIPAALQYVKKITPSHVEATALTMYAAIGNGFGNWFCTFAGGYIFDYVSIFAVYLLFGMLSIAGFGLTLYLMKAEKNKNTLHQPAVTFKP